MPQTLRVSKGDRYFKSEKSTKPRYHWPVFQLILPLIPELFPLIFYVELFYRESVYGVYAESFDVVDKPDHNHKINLTITISLSLLLLLLFLLFTICSAFRVHFTILRTTITITIDLFYFILFYFIYLFFFLLSK